MRFRPANQCCDSKVRIAQLTDELSTLLSKENASGYNTLEDYIKVLRDKCEEKEKLLEGTKQELETEKEK